VAATEHQTAGRGRTGRHWLDEPGASLLLSVLLRPPRTTAAAQLSLVCALAVAETVERATALEAGVKWPNDVLVEGRKVAGILLEGREGAVVCGIGLNANQAAGALPRDTSTPVASLRTLTGREHDREELLATLLERLETRYDAWRLDGLAPLRTELERRNAVRAREVRIGDEVGIAGPIAADGRLTLSRADGTTVLVASGEVTELPD
jgi:BirA family biotin operon repressor/biotin-[acetyl-CoA-carboxylase] ligase